MPPTAPEQLAQMYPWLPQGSIDAYTTNYNAGAADPWALVRQDPNYETWFPGNLLDDGQTRHTEHMYAGIIEGYKLALGSIELDPENPIWEDMFASMIRGDVSPNEAYEDRIKPVYDRIMFASDSIQQVYSQRWGVDLTPQSLIAMALAPDMTDDILSGQIEQAEIAGEALESGFKISEAMLDQLQRADFDKGQADELFSSAANILPTLSVLARRHSDPDDEFDLETFVNATEFKDPSSRRRMRSMVKQEQAMFANTGIANARNREGGQIGLETA